MILTAASGLACNPEALRPRSQPGGRRPPAVKLDNWYRPDDEKVAVYSTGGAELQVRTAEGRIAFTVPGDGGSIEGRADSPG
jgi:hypothetical protein